MSQAFTVPAHNPDARHYIPHINLSRLFACSSGTTTGRNPYFAGRRLQPSRKSIPCLIGVNRRARPGVSNIDLYLILASDNSQAETMAQAEVKADVRQAQVYMYYFNWRSPVRHGKLKAFYTVELPFVFDNVDLAPSMVGTGPNCMR